MRSYFILLKQLKSQQAFGIAISQIVEVLVGLAITTQPGQRKRGQTIAPAAAPQIPFAIQAGTIGSPHQLGSVSANKIPTKLRIPIQGKIP